jgi:ubiquinone/menaquinone biosynthesis C-methylase UbiE
MIGVDPAPAMIEIARHQPYGDQVRWIVGSADQLDVTGADLTIMTGHVAQFFLTDESWHQALTALHRALKPGGHLAFESRNPAAREWESWTPEARSFVDDPQAGRVDTWSEVQNVQDNVISYTLHYLFANTGDELLAPCKLRFRFEEELINSLIAAGFSVKHIYGDWDRRPAGPQTRELIFVAKKSR